MRRASRVGSRLIAAGTLASLSLWLGCNALLDIESAVYAPDAAPGGSGGTSALGPDATGMAEGGEGIEGGGNCGDTTSDPHHCGRCDHDCQGGGCNLGTCQPVLVATDVGGPFSIALDDRYVYWNNGAANRIARAPKAGGVSETVFLAPAGAQVAEGVFVVGGEIYFGIGGLDPDAGGVMRCPVAGCLPTGPDVVRPGAVVRIHLSADGVLTFATFAEIYRCDLPCPGTPELVAEGEGPRVIGLASGPGEVFWSRVSADLRGRPDGEAPTTLASNAFVDEIVPLGDEVYFAQLAGGVVAIQRDGGARRALLRGATIDSDHLVLRDGLVFFNDIGGAGLGDIRVCPVAGCSDGGGVVAPGQDDPRGVAVDDTTIYWANSGTGPADAGAIMRLAR
jgi:hypothetical protein